MSLLPSNVIEAIDGLSKTEIISTPETSFLNSIFLKKPLEYTERIDSFTLRSLIVSPILTGK